MLCFPSVERLSLFNVKNSTDLNRQNPFEWVCAKKIPVQP